MSRVRVPSLTPRRRALVRLLTRALPFSGVSVGRRIGGRHNRCWKAAGAGGAPGVVLTRGGPRSPSAPPFPHAPDDDGDDHHAEDDERGIPTEALLDLGVG